MKKGTLKNGQNIDFLKAHWVKDQYPSPPALLENVESSDLSLAWFKQRDSDEWNIPML